MSKFTSIDRLIGSCTAAAKWLALPLVLLLFLQWPLREIVRAYSREANDLGQIIFALYVAVSVTAATRAGTHLAADTLAHRYSARVRRRLTQIGAAFGLLPWAVFVIFAGNSIIVSSVQLVERFPETYNPGYFIIKTALWLMSGLVAAQAVIDIVLPRRSGDG